MTTTDDILEIITQHINTKPGYEATATIQSKSLDDHLEIRVSHKSDPGQDKDILITIANDKLDIELWDMSKDRPDVKFKTIHLSDSDAIDQLDKILQNHWV